MRAADRAVTQEPARLDNRNDIITSFLVVMDATGMYTCNTLHYLNFFPALEWHTLRLACRAAQVVRRDKVPYCTKWLHSYTQSVVMIFFT
jgi:hypothetical protein